MKKEEFVMILDNWLKSYDVKIFPELDEGQLKEIHSLLKTKMNIPLDRLSAQVCRFVLNGIKKEILEDKTEE